MSEQIIDIANDILKRVDIVDVISSFIKVSKKGRNYVALCPFHNDTNPSMSISREKQIFKCFVCGAGGNAITFVKKYKQCSFLEAIKIVAQIGGITDVRLDSLEKTSTNKINPEFAKVYDCLSEINKLYSVYLFNTDEGRNTALLYLHDRGLNDDVINKFKIGYSIKNGSKTTEFLSKNGFSLKTIEKTGIGTINNGTITDSNCGRVIFSISNEDGQIVGFSARELTNDKSKPKYVNSPESVGGVFHKSNILYNYFNAKDFAKREKYIYVVEGFMDAIALDRIGIHNVVALMGTALTKEHIRLLRFLGVEIRLCLDNDQPGQDAMVKIAKLLKENELNYVFVSNNQNFNGKDSDEILKNEGPENLKKYVSTLISEGEFILNFYSKKLDMNSLIDKKTILKEYIPFLASITDKVDLELYANKLSKISGFSLEIIYSQIKSFKSKQNNDNNKSESITFKKKNPVLTRLELGERQIIRYMLENEDAVKLYNEKLGYFVNDTYREIAALLEEYLNSSFKDTKYSSSSIINYINYYKKEIGEKEKENIINNISSISMDNFVIPPYSHKAFNDCVKVINEEKELRRINEVYVQSTIGKSNIDKAKEALALLEQKKALLKEKERGK